MEFSTTAPLAVVGVLSDHYCALHLSVAVVLTDQQHPHSRGRCPHRPPTQLETIIPLLYIEIELHRDRTFITGFVELYVPEVLYDRVGVGLRPGS